METIRHEPIEGVYPPSGDYVHALEVRGAARTLYVAGTMGLDAQGLPGADLETQLALIWNNIRTILAVAGMTTANIVRVTSYLRDAAFAEANAAARTAALAGNIVPTTAIVAQTLSPDWLVEIEVIAAA